MRFLWQYSDGIFIQLAIFVAAFAADGLLAVKFYSMATGADPPFPARRISGHKGVIGHTACYNSAGPDKRISADGVAANDGTVSA